MQKGKPPPAPGGAPPVADGRRKLRLPTEAKQLRRSPFLFKHLRVNRQVDSGFVSHPRNRKGILPRYCIRPVSHGKEMMRAEFLIDKRPRNTRSEGSIASVEVRPSQLCCLARFRIFRSIRKLSHQIGGPYFCSSSLLTDKDHDFRTRKR